MRSAYVGLLAGLFVIGCGNSLLEAVTADRDSLAKKLGEAEARAKGAEQQLALERAATESARAAVAEMAAKVALAEKVAAESKAAMELAQSDLRAQERMEQVRLAREARVEAMKREIANLNDFDKERVNRIAKTLDKGEQLSPQDEVFARKLLVFEDDFRRLDGKKAH